MTFRRRVFCFYAFLIICICIPPCFFFLNTLLKLAHQQHSLDALAWNESRLQFKSVGNYFAVTPKNGTPGVNYRLPFSFKYRSCENIARSFEEPLSARYHPRPAAVSPLGENAPRAYWRWPGNISKESFESAAAREWPGCLHCMNIVRYKVLGRKLYVAESAPGRRHQNVAEEMLQVVLYLFPIPDMEFLLHFGDGCVNGLPVISWNVCRQFADAGFTMPSYTVWERSMGPMQLMLYSTCLEKRYPARKRKPLVIWRGSTTDTQLDKFTKDNYLQAIRIRLHQFARKYRNILDIRIVQFFKCDDFVKEQLNDTGSWIAFERFNKFCAILDIDGNSWSDRFGQLVHFNTPILKMESNYTGYFEHLFAPDTGIIQFAKDFSDLPEKARQLVADCQQDRRRGGTAGGRGRRIAKNMQVASQTLMDQVGIAEAFAYTLQVYKNLSSWEVDPSLKGFKEVNLTCCSFTQVPKLLAAAVSEYHGRTP
ncbi:hypothetical protein Vafri_13272 [Volvox africanus]|uniref:Glycosyl transferase CAP10 domain-containing protein n=1 Tax=Volvox africanus TaxID=51714 RepID=A0A8J4F652_9CHLO|nr:hypothetical protein Vafri_13272 [Volvox africanus]